LDDLFAWLLDHAWAGIAAAFGYFYKRNETNRDNQMKSLSDRVDRHQETISDKLVKKDELTDLKNYFSQEFRYMRDRLDEIADRK